MHSNRITNDYENMALQKEQNKAPKNNPTEIEIFDLPDKN